jgi:hypothetical protein
MVARIVAVALLAVFLAPAAKKTVAEGKGENQELALTVTLYTTPEDVKELLGDDLGGHFIVADVKVEPRYGKEVSISRDDFVLRTDKDGEKTTPFAASQIAGRGALVVRQTQQGGSRAAVGLGMPGSGYPGGYPGGYPPSGTGGPSAGSGGEGDTSTPEATVRNAARDKPNPLEQVLKDKGLPEKKTAEPVSGLLYFCMEKQKVKDLELSFGGRENRVTLRFK